MNMTHSSKGTVLVIDDRPENMQVLIAALQDCGVTIVVTSQGEPALELAAQVTPDLILLDVRKPDMQGLETFRRIRANPETHDIPVIVMTSPAETETISETAAASTMAENVDDCESASVDYLTTPFQAKEVIARVTTHLTIRKLKRQISEQQHQNTMNFREAIEAYEKDLIVTALEHNRGNMAQTASSLDIPLRTLYRKIKHYRLS
jgi:DNA-binding NtrC family response regulator